MPDTRLAVAACVFAVSTFVAAALSRGEVITLAPPEPPLTLTAGLPSLIDSPPAHGWSLPPPSYLLAQSPEAQDRPEQHNSQNEANNPLTPKITINFHNYYIPEFEGIDEWGNQFLFRGLVPHKLFDLPQLFRFTLPVITTPDADGDHTTGVGDLTLMNLFVIPKKPFEFGVGPMLVVPMGPEETSSEKWQVGAAGIAIAPQKWGLLGGLVTFQQSFAGDSDRDDVTLVTFQPIAIYNLPEGFYLRSSAIWNFDFNNDTYYIPIGFGAGKVIELNDKVTVNAFIEPQYTVFEDNDAAPEWQIFFGVNFQFAMK